MRAISELWVTLRSNSGRIGMTLLNGLFELLNPIPQPTALLSGFFLRLTLHVTYEFFVEIRGLLAVFGDHAFFEPGEVFFAETGDFRLLFAGFSDASCG